MQKPDEVRLKHRGYLLTVVLGFCIHFNLGGVRHALHMSERARRLSSGNSG